MTPVPLLVVFVAVLSHLGVDAQKEDCAKGKQFAYDLEDCNKFYTCVGPLSYHMTCSPGLVFSLEQKGCVFKDDEMAKDCLTKAAKLAYMKKIKENLVKEENMIQGNNGQDEKDEMNVNVDDKKDEEKKLTETKFDDEGEKNGEMKKKKQAEKKIDGETMKKKKQADKKIDGETIKNKEMKEKKLAENNFDGKTTEDVEMKEKKLDEKISKDEIDQVEETKKDETKDENGDKVVVQIETTTEKAMNNNDDENNEEDGDDLVFDVRLADADFFAENYANPIAVDPHCTSDQKILPHETLCHRYYNCTQSHHLANMNKYLTPHEYECPYPKLFSVDTMSCQDFQSVQCGERMEYTDPCDYTENMCSGPNCKPCPLDHASCVDQPDGLNYWPGREGSGFWVECQGQRTIHQGNCAENDPSMRSIFSRDLKKCVPYSDVIKEVCEWSESRLPHPYECHLFFDCNAISDEGQEADEVIDDTETAGTSLSSPSSPSSQYIRMCPYPLLYSVRDGKCVDPIDVDCGSRREAKTPCEYMPTECVDPSFASCEGLPDGKNVFRTREGTPHFVICQNERTMEKGMCEMDDRGMYKQFSPGVGKCMDV